MSARTGGLVTWSPFASLRDLAQRAHPLVKLSYLPRFVALTFAAPALSQFENRPWTAFDTAYVVTALLSPHLWFFGSALFWNTRAAGRAAMLWDAVLNGVVVALYGGSLAVVVPFAVVTLSNAISVGGLAFMAQAGLTMAATAWVARTALPASFAAGRLSPAGELGTFLFLAFYQCLSAFSMRAQARRINAMRHEVSSANGLLEARVAERTATLASTNAAIQHFVPREFLYALGHDDVTTTKLGDATAKSLTVLFADIRDFTAMSERLTPEETFAFLNGCLSKLGPHVRAHSGFVDKYIGDAIMALFPRDPSDAVRAAVAMQEELRRTSEGAGDRVPLAIGVGIHVGRVMMGTIGEAERFEATVISDAVNLTARLESLTKQLGCSVLISGEVHATLGEELRAHTRRLGTFLVKGKAQAVTIHEVFSSDPEPLRDAKLRTRARFEAMLDAFAEGRVEEALAIASELRDACSEDGPAAWWFMRLVQECAPGDNALPSMRGIVLLEKK